MKILLYTDVHFSTYSSIVRSRGARYSSRLENLIDSLNWAENMANMQQCDAVFCLGDFFDQSTLNPEEITALKEIQWSPVEHWFLVGNHEMGRNTLEYSSSHLFNLCANAKVIDSPCNFKLADESTEICMLPYILNVDKNIQNYFKPLDTVCDRRIVFSHNDLKNVQYGPYVSKSGFEVPDIESYCSMFLNGHIHNGAYITSKILNLGNLTGQNFNEDGSAYLHCCAILDTKTLQLSFYENPHAYKFYKISINSKADFDVKSNQFKNNSVVTVKCYEQDAEYIKSKISTNPNVVDFRILLEVEKASGALVESLNQEDLTKIDHISTFNDFVKSTVGVDDITLFELGEISK